MEISKQEALEDFEFRLLADVPEARVILETFRRADLELTRVEPVDTAGTKPVPTRTWLLFWQPSEPLRERFDLAPELLMVLVSWRESQARHIDEAERALRRDSRLDRGMVLFITRDERAEMHLEQAIRHTGRLYIVLSFEELSAVGDPQRWLREIFLERIGASDLFAAGPPVLGWDFVGRDRELRAIRNHLLKGHPVGLYGLRKVGKTSVLIKLREQMMESSTTSQGSASTIPIHVDLLSISFVEQNRAGFMRSLLRAMHEAIELAGLDPTVLNLPASFTDRRRLGQLDSQDVERLVPEALECLIDWARSQPGGVSILLFIDEYERLLNGILLPQPQGIAIFDYLRGQMQLHPGTFNLLIAGIDRRLSSVPRFANRQNPLFNFVVDFPLSGLEREELNELFKKIGRRLLLRFEQDAVDAVWEETGGHPFLARELGRVIDRSISPRERTPKRIDRALVMRFQEQFRQLVSPTMQEIHGTVSDLDPLAPEVLRYMLTFPEESEAALRGLKPQVVDTLRNYGILHTREAGGMVRIGCFGAWLLENQALTKPAANG